MPSNKQTKKDLEQLGQMLVSIYETGYTNRKQFYKMTFVKGVLNGLGTVVGATILVALLLWILSLFESVPLLDNIIESTKNSVNSSK